jgi:circadian clock protein KaiC
MNDRWVPERVETGISGLDKMLNGGLFRGTATLVKGAPGTGKTNLGLEFIARGAMQYDEPGAIITFEHFPKKLHRDADSIGMPLSELEKTGRVRTIFTSPEILLSQVKKEGGLLDQLVHEVGIRRILIDSISHLERLAQDGWKLREMSFSLINGMLRHELTVIVTQEEQEIMGTMDEIELGIPFLVDTVIVLGYVEVDSSIRRALLILKQRASDHDKSIREFRITDRGIVIEDPFLDREGVLSGMPQKKEIDAFMEVFGKKEEGERKREG